jgi:hypothetical protein
LKKLIGGLSLFFSGFTFAVAPTEAQLVALAKRVMFEQKDISSIELYNMYGKNHPKMAILPISGTSWKPVMEQMPEGYIKSIAGNFNSRADSADLIESIDARYKTAKFETANTIVTRSNGYTFCLVDDGLRQEFEHNAGFLRTYFAGILPVYFEREDVFLFMRHHEASHCLDPDDTDSSDEQKFLSTMIHEATADLTATLVYANRYGDFDLFFKAIRPMRMANSMDVEHTTEDIVEHMISGLTPADLYGVDFSKIMKIRADLISRFETKEYLEIMIKNAYEKQAVSLYLKKRIEKNGQYQSPDVSRMLDKNTDILNTLVTREIYNSIDMDQRYDAMVNSSVDNLRKYRGKVDMGSAELKDFGRLVGVIGLKLRPETLARVQSLYR